MSNESLPEGPTERPRSGLPQFDPGAPGGVHTGDTQLLPSAWASQPQDHPVPPPASPYAYAASPASPPTPPPAEPTSRARRWSGRKTAVTAGLAIVLASAGAIGAAAALPAGSGGDNAGFRGAGGFGGAGGRHGFRPQGGQQNQQGQLPQQLPNLQNGGPAGGLNGVDPNQLTPQDLLQRLQQLGQDDQGADPFGDLDHDSGPGSGQGGTSASGGTRTT
ncbi:hypothetical protein GCM10009740_19650 [Terrabacter terrae]|uniref:Uncharacterized protein n=1 Tax=Terrabacter terrae TaxID=318434 RepID=A0ABN2U5V3_9MICO